MNWKTTWKKQKQTTMKNEQTKCKKEKILKKNNKNLYEWILKQKKQCLIISTVF